MMFLVNRTLAQEHSIFSNQGTQIEPLQKGKRDDSIIENSKMILVR
jgi:hypothetical protein